MIKSIKIKSLIPLIIIILLSIFWKVMILPNELKYYFLRDIWEYKNDSIYYILGFQIIILIFFYGKNLLYIKNDFFPLGRIIFIALISFTFFEQAYLSIILPLNRQNIYSVETNKFRINWKGKSDSEYLLDLYDLNKKRGVGRFAINSHVFQKVQERDTIKLEFYTGLFGIRSSAKIID